MISKRLMLGLVTTLFTAVLFASPAGAAQPGSPVITIGQPPWPGVTIKDAVVARLISSLGYRTRILSVGDPFVYRGLADGDIDVYMAGWMPVEKGMMDKVLQSGRAQKIGQNLSGAIEGVAVPEYTWKRGIHTVKELAAHAGWFGHRIYGIENGASINKVTQRAIRDDHDGLKGWTLVASSTAGMLTEVKRKTEQHEPVAFLAWKPHWMNVIFHIRYLKDTHGSQVARLKSRVFTVVTTGFAKHHPNVARFLGRFRISAATQSHWVYRHSYKKIAANKVADQWLQSHPAKVRHWLKGVRAANGRPAYAVYRKVFGASDAALACASGRGAGC